MAFHGGITSGIIGGIFAGPGPGVETDPFSGISVAAGSRPAPSPSGGQIGSDFGTVGVVPGTDVFGRPDSGIGKLGEFGPGLTPLPSITPDFSTFDTSKFALGGFGIDTPGGKFTFDPKTGFNFESGLGGLRSERTQLAFAEADRLDQVAEDLNFGPLTKARLAEFDRREQALDLAESETIGGLRDQLGARRVLGASFANAQISREKASFRQTRNDLANRRALVAGESKLQEFQLRQQALTKASQARIGAIQANITDIFGETELASQLGAQFAQIMADDLRLRLAIEFADLQQQRNLAQRERESLRGDFQATKAGEREESAGFGKAAGFIIDRIFGGGIF